MRLVTYDIEVTAYDWLVVFKDYATKTYTAIWNDAEELTACIQPDYAFCGFNSKNYDRYIIYAIINGFTPQEIKKLNDFIIGGGQGWQYPGLNTPQIVFNNIDIRDDVQQGLSLKAIEGHLGMDIRETTVPFDIDRPLTEAEREEMEFYCKHDVDATEKLIDLRKDYLQTKANLGRRAKIDEITALASTNAKLTAMMLKAKYVPRNDGREYVYPQNLDLSIIPQEILDFFEQIHDKSIPDDDLFSRSLDIEIGGMPCKYAWGGVHGSLLCYFEAATKNRVIRNSDVSSLYPSLIELYKYLSRNVPDPELFYQIRRDRINAKKTSDKQLAKDLKLPLNTVSGAQENPYNDLYDPLPTRSLRISGQLFLTVLTMRLLKECKTIKLLNLNTDGLAYSIDKSELAIAEKIEADWQKETGFELETDHISKIWIKDVNNLLIIKENDEIKTVGGYLNYGISVKGAWTINNNATIVKKAMVDYFVKGIPLAETITACNDPLQFQLIAKAGSKYREAYQIVNNEKVPTQKVNRVYATADTSLGTLYKVHAVTGRTAKIESLPEHCIIDNDNHLTVEAIDKGWYIALAEKRLADFVGEENKGGQLTLAAIKLNTDAEKKDEKKEVKATKEAKEEKAVKPVKEEPKPDYSQMTVPMRLLVARTKFLQAGAKKTGRNADIGYKYFELDDIVPIATPIFAEVGLFVVTTFAEDHVEGVVLDALNAGADPLVIRLPMRYPSENRAINPVQALGGAITYLRRYVYMVLLDICEPDAIEPTTVPDKPKTAAAPAQREAAKATLTAPDEPATDLQLAGLKRVMSELVKKKPETRPMIEQLAVATQGYTQMSKKDCEAAINKFREMLKEGESK